MRKREKSWYKAKGYLHISSKLGSYSKDSVLKYIETKLNDHNFFPLIHETLTTRRYKKLANGKRSHFDKSSGRATAKKREIFYANHLDAHIYSYFANELLGKKYEDLLKRDELLDQSVIAYRKIPVSADEESNKCNIHFAKEVFEEIKKQRNCIVVCYDIENFFPSLDHEYLKTCWCNLLKVEKLDSINDKVYKSLTQFSYVELKDVLIACSDLKKGVLKKYDFIKAQPKLKSYFINAKEFRQKIAAKNLIKVNPRNKETKESKGIPQGTPISAFLANLYLYEFDRFIVENIVRGENCFYRRYSDDIVIIFKNEEQFNEWDEKVRDMILSPPFCLKINETKTTITRFIESETRLKCETKPENSKEYNPGINLRYLGFDFDGEKVLLKNSSLSRYMREMKMVLKHKGTRVENARKLNRLNLDPYYKDTKLYLTKLMRKFTHLGKNKAKSNFLTYSDRAARIMYPDMEIKENPIRKQVKRSWSIFNRTANRYR